MAEWDIDMSISMGRIWVESHCSTSTSDIDGPTWVQFQFLASTTTPHFSPPIIPAFNWSKLCVIFMCAYQFINNFGLSGALDQHWSPPRYDELLQASQSLCRASESSLAKLIR